MGNIEFARKKIPQILMKRLDRVAKVVVSKMETTAAEWQKL